MSVSDFDPGFLLLIPSAIGYMKTRINMTHFVLSAGTD